MIRSVRFLLLQLRVFRIFTKYFLGIFYRLQGLKIYEKFFFIFFLTRHGKIINIIFFIPGLILVRVLAQFGMPHVSVATRHLHRYASHSYPRDQAEQD